MAQATGTQSSFNEFLATPIDFSVFIMNQLKIDNLTQEIEDKVSRIWSPVKVFYDKHAYWGTYHWGLKRQKFYGYATNMESLKYVYSRHMIIAITILKIMQFFGYSHLEEIIVRRQDDQNYSKYRRMLPSKDTDGTLNHVRTALNDITTGLEMDYLPKRKWSKQDKQRACVMINAIDKKLKDRRLMRKLENFVGGRPYGGDLRLLERTI
ncbi:hypothetical protein Tco_1327168 [Tanacetum coccineum]